MNIIPIAKPFFLTLLLVQFSFSLLASSTSAQVVFDFENLELPSGFKDGNPDLDSFGAVIDVTLETPLPFGPSGGVIRQVDQTFTFSQGGTELILPNSYFEADGFDDFFFGFSASTIQDNTTPGPNNRFASFSGGGSGGSGSYLVASGDTSFSAVGRIASIDIAPTTFTALAIRDGDDGGNNFISGALPDLNGFFDLIISGNNSAEQISVSFGDYTNGESFDPPDFFQTIDVSSLNSSTLSFTYEGSDVGPFGLNTPAFFAADNIVVGVPEPSACGLLLLIAGGALAGGRFRRK